MTEREMFEASFSRPKNFFKLSERQQWEIDKSLGILDWVGNDLSEDDKKRFNAHYGIKEERPLKNIVVGKCRDSHGIIGDGELWDESPENLKTTLSGSGPFQDVVENTSGIFLADIRFNTNIVTPKMAKEIIKTLQKALKAIGHNQENKDVKTTIIPN